ncbi:uncharacterized protein LOC132732686 [Ruditapes philippinarum]|uniref:uncharacterized protein LOC132732686 n=1 Tax=Ruditapes philippinarum TaxID=129788 RepID=UPI00295BE302|nr:uncharacterized protein LOC132732686 [Ruditapes philippinarum]
MDYCTIKDYCMSKNYCTSKDYYTIKDYCTSEHYSTIKDCYKSQDYDRNEDYCTSEDYCTGGVYRTSKDYCTSEDYCTIKDFCKSEDFCQILANQVCNNCGIGPECSVYFNVTWPVARDYECWQLCDNNINCTVATFDGSSNCRLYDCSKIGQKIGSKAYRKSSNLDCNEFEVYYFTDYEGKCPVITTNSGATSAESCLEGCLGKPTCRGTTFDASTNTCLFHDNSCSPVSMTSPYKTFIERVCVNEQPACVRDQTQMCVNCRAGLLCQTTFNQNLETKPLNIDTSVIGVDSDVEQIWYFANGSSYMYIQCPYVAQQIGDTVYRATCTLDCPKFELLTLPGHRGSCSWLSTLSGGVTLEYCMSKCLDMVNCRAVTYNSNSASCNFHGCTDYAVSAGYDFIIRRCLNESGCDASSKIVQTCVNCAPGPNCHDYYQSNVNKKLETDCLTIKTSDSDSTIVHYHRSYSSCNRTQCSQVRQEIGELVYRDSCNIDCQKFEIFQLDDVGGSCDVIHTEEGGLTFHYCIEKCLDMPGCRGSTFASSTGKCEYHNCSNHTTSPGQRFMWKHCIDYEPQRDYQQICDCCAMSDLCQKFAGALVTPYPSWETCEVQFQSSESRDVIMYRTYTNGCFLMNCTMIVPFLDFLL